MPGKVSLERHHRTAGGADARELGQYDVVPPDHVDLRKSKNKPLSPSLSAKVLVPLCQADLSKDRGKNVVSLAWSALQAAGFRQYFCFVRGPEDCEEIVVVLKEGSVSWPVCQLVPDAVDFLEVQAM